MNRIKIEHKIKRIAGWITWDLWHRTLVMDSSWRIVAIDKPRARTTS